MNRVEITKKLLVKNKNNWGLVANAIQDRAEICLPLREFNIYLAKAERDQQECEGTDYICFNGQSFDWKVFQSQADKIVLAFLDYFTDAQLERMYPEGGEY